jgi:surface antigen
MRRLFRTFAVLALAAGLLARPALADGWLDDMRNAGPGQIGLNKTTAGALIGAIGGGLLGGQIGNGKGQLATTAIGVLGGALAGGYIGRQLDQADQLSMDRTEQRALAQNRQVAWRNPDSGNSGAVTPLRTYRTEAGRTCRDYERTVVVEGRAEPAYATACRNGVGEWEVQP